MTRVGLDQLLQVAAPAPTPRASSRPGAEESEPFRSHLDRAAEAAAPKEKLQSEDSRVERTDDSENVEIEGEQQENANAETEVSGQAAESDHSETSESEQTPPEETSTEDEVTLSAAAVVQVETQVNTEIPAEQVTTEASAQSEGNSQQGEQSAEQSGEVPNTTSQPKTTEEPLLAEGVEKTAKQVEEPQKQQADTGEQPTEQQAATTSERTTGVAVATAGTPDSSKPASGDRKPANGTTSTPTTTVEDTSAAHILPEQEEQQGSRTAPATNPTQSTIVTTADQFAAQQSELDVVPAAQLSDAEAKPVATPTAPTATTEIIAGVEKSLGAVNANANSGSADLTGNVSDPEAPTVDRVRFVQRVSGAIRSAEQRDGQIQLRLSPPELGTLKIQLTVSEGAITANLETETAAARTVLLDNLPALREKLAEQGMTIEKFDVDVGREGHQQQADGHSANERDSKPSQNRTNAKSVNTSEQESPNPQSVIPSQAAEADSGLDIRI